MRKCAGGDRTKDALVKFQDAIRQSEFIDPDAEAMLEVLVSPGEARGSGSTAAMILAPSVDTTRRSCWSATCRAARLHRTAVGGPWAVSAPAIMGAIYALDPSGGGDRACSTPT